MTIFSIISTGKDYFQNQIDNKLSFSEPPRRKITIFRRTSTEKYNFRNHLDGKLPFSIPPRWKITIFGTTLMENYNFRNDLDQKIRISWTRFYDLESNLCNFESWSWWSKIFRIIPKRASWIHSSNVLFFSAKWFRNRYKNQIDFQLDFSSIGAAFWTPRATLKSSIFY